MSRLALHYISIYIHRSPSNVTVICYFVHYNMFYYHYKLHDIVQALAVNRVV